MKIDVSKVEKNAHRHGTLFAAIYEQIITIKEGEKKLLPSFYDSFKEKDFSIYEIRACLSHVGRINKIKYRTMKDGDNLYAGR